MSELGIYFIMNWDFLRFLRDGYQVSISRDCLELFEADLLDFLERFVTTDETWIHYNTPESKLQSKE